MDLDKLLIRSVERGASDLHLKPNSPPVLRIHGRLVPQPDLGVVSVGEMEDMARHILSERTYGQLKDGREVDVAYAVRDHGRFRVNLFLATGYIRAVMRAIPSKKPKFEELYLPKVLEKLAMERRGMILVTGITGSGKSTTLAAMIDFMNRSRNDHIITIEDPIEFAHEDKKCVVSQRGVGYDSENSATASGTRRRRGRSRRSWPPGSRSTACRRLTSPCSPCTGTRWSRTRRPATPRLTRMTSTSRSKASSRRARRCSR